MSCGLSDAERTGGVGSARRSVLLVEDEALIREMLAFEFEDEGFEVHQAGGADEAVGLFEEGLKVGAVVTDVRMPGRMDGLGLATWLAQHRPFLTVVITSGYAAPADVAHLKASVAAIMPKPYKPSDVVAFVHRSVAERDPP